MPSKITIIRILPVVFLLLIESAILGASQSTSGGGRCVEKERQALLEFKAGLKDPSGRLSSWAGEDCCNWTGVICSNQTGKVVKLDLRTTDSCDSVDGNGAAPNRSCLGGTLNPSLLDLKYLNYLDMSSNNFQAIPIPNFIGSLQKLTYLDLSRANFSGMIPPQLGNLSSLVLLDLTPNLDTTYPWVSDLNWLSGLQSLQYLLLNRVNLSKASANWLPAVNKLPSLLELHLSDTELHDLPQSLPFSNLTSLSILDLSENNFRSSIPQWVFNISSLQELEIYNCQLTGSIPEVSLASVGNLKILDLSFNALEGEIKEFIDALAGCANNSLETLDLDTNNLHGDLPHSMGLLSSLINLRLARNKFTGPIQTSLWNMSQLSSLDLSFNVMHGTIPESIGKLRLLSTLALYGNSLDGIVTQSFLNLTFLYTLSLSSTNYSLVFDMPNDWIPPFRLLSLSITGCKLGPVLPRWLKTQTRIMEVTLSNCLIAEHIPDWIWAISPWIVWIDLSNNQLRGTLPSSIHYYSSGVWVDLSFNQLEGPIPIWPYVTSLSLKKNLFSGPIPLNIGEAMAGLENLDISHNNINGTLPPSMSNLRSLNFLDLSGNNLSGTLPSNWQDLRILKIVDLSHNNLFGGIPRSLCSLPALFWLKLNNNNLYGEVSSTLLNCTRLQALDIGGNRFFGTLPNLLPDSLSYLGLRANMLSGSIPESLCDLRWLHILDFAHNNLSGSIPNCIGNLTTLKIPSSYSQFFPATEHIAYFQHTDLVVKGRPIEYSNTIILVKLIDMSANSLSGEMPKEITSLSMLGILNLSMNQLTGKMPDNVGNLKQLESLDLSLNHLSGPIPASMSSMTFLNHLNLSFNNFSGAIPSTNQFLTFNDPSIFEGNPYLCGSPLPNACDSSNIGDAESNLEEEVTDENDYETFGFYASIAAGFIVGFWGVCGSLMLKKSWRYAFFRFVDELRDWVFVLITVCIPRMRRQR